MQDVGLDGTDDPTLLAWAANTSRVLLTHDVSTITAYAYDRARNGDSMPGVFEVSRDVPIVVTVEDISADQRMRLPGRMGRSGPVSPTPLKTKIDVLSLEFGLHPLHNTPVASPAHLAILDQVDQRLNST